MAQCGLFAISAGFTPAPLGGADVALAGCLRKGRALCGQPCAVVASRFKSAPRNDIGHRGCRGGRLNETSGCAGTAQVPAHPSPGLAALLLRLAASRTSALRSGDGLGLANGLLGSGLLRSCLLCFGDTSHGVVLSRLVCGVSVSLSRGRSVANRDEMIIRREIRKLNVLKAFSKPKTKQSELSESFLSRKCAE